MQAWIAGKISRGGFSSERTYEVHGCGQQIARGTANERYFRDPLWRYIQPPKAGALVHGFVECRVLKVMNSIALIELPCVPEAGSGEQITVWLCDMKDKPKGVLA